MANESCVVVFDPTKLPVLVENDPIPWAAPLTLAMEALKRAEKFCVERKFNEAIAELRLAEENARHCRYCVEATR